MQKVKHFLQIFMFLLELAQMSIKLNGFGVVEELSPTQHFLLQILMLVNKSQRDIFIMIPRSNGLIQRNLATPQKLTMFVKQ